MTVDGILGKLVLESEAVESASFGTTPLLALTEARECPCDVGRHGFQSHHDVPVPDQVFLPTIIREGRLRELNSTFRQAHQPKYG